MVSGTISLPSRGTFHHSLTVLIHYRSTGSIQAYQVVLADSHGIPRAPSYSGNHSTAAERITTTGLSPSTVDHPRSFVYTPAPHRDVPADTPRAGPQHRTCNPCRVSHTYGLAPSAFARHYSRNHFCFLFLWVLRCFTSLRSLQPAYVFSRRSHDLERRAGFPHSEILVSTSGYRLHQAYRRFPRPSSAPVAKASTMRP